MAAASVADASCTRVRFSTPHVGFVYALAVLSNGWFATGGEDKHVKLWDEKGVYKGKMPTCESWVYALEALPKGGLAIANKNNIEIWDAVTGEHKKVLRGHTAQVWSLALLPDGTLVSGGGSGDTVIRRWDLATGECTQVLSGHTAPVTCLLALSDGRLASSSGYDGTLRIWDLASGTCVQTIVGSTDTVLDACTKTLVSLPGNRLASCGSSAAKVWDLKTGECVLTCKISHRIMTSMAYLSEGLLVVCCSDGNLHTWNLRTYKYNRPIGKKLDWAYTMKALPDGRLLTGGGAGLVDLFEFGDGAISLCKSIKEDLMAAAWNPERAGAEWLIMQEFEEDE